MRMRDAQNQTVREETYLRFAFRHAICHVAGFQIQSISLQQRKHINYVTRIVH